MKWINEGNYEDVLFCSPEENTIEGTVLDVEAQAFHKKYDLIFNHVYTETESGYYALTPLLKLLILENFGKL